MIGVLIVSHGSLASQLLATAEMILGKQERVLAMDLHYEDNIEDFRQVVNQAVMELRSEAGVIVLADLFGGSPANAVAYNLRELNFKAVTGVNLPMLIECLSARGDSDLTQLAEQCMAVGREGIRDLSSCVKKPEVN